MLEDSPCLEVVETVGDVRKSVSSTLVVVPSVSSVDAVARIKVPEGLKGGIIMAEEFYEDL